MIRETSDLRYKLSLQIKESRAHLTMNVTDRNRRPGYPDFGQQFNRKETAECFYPYTVPLDMFLARQ